MKRLHLNILVSICMILFAGLLLWLNYRKVFKWLVYDKPLDYSKPFGPAISGADRVVIRKDGFDCCRPIDENKILFVVSSPDEIAELKKNIHFKKRITTNSLMESCLCCGEPVMDWYKGNRLPARTALQHWKAIRWRGFSTKRILWFRCGGYGDGLLTEESQIWLREWFRKHGYAVDYERQSAEA